MGIDEAGTLSRLNGLRRELIDPAIAAKAFDLVDFCELAAKNPGVTGGSTEAD